MTHKKSKILFYFLICFFVFFSVIRIPKGVFADEAICDGTLTIRNGNPVCKITGTENNCGDGISSLCIDESFITSAINEGKNYSFASYSEETGLTLTVDLTPTKFAINNATKIYFSSNAVTINNPDLDITLTASYSVDFRETEINTAKRLEVTKTDNNAFPQIIRVNNVLVQGDLDKGAVALEAVKRITFENIQVLETPSDIGLLTYDEENGEVIGKDIFNGAYTDNCQQNTGKNGGDVTIQAHIIDVGKIYTASLGYQKEAGDITLNGDYIYTTKDLVLHALMGWRGVPNFWCDLYNPGGKPGSLYISGRKNNTNPEIVVIGKKDSASIKARGLPANNIEISVNKVIMIQGDIENYGGCDPGELQEGKIYRENIVIDKCDYCNSDESICLCGSDGRESRSYCSKYASSGDVILKSDGLVMIKGKIDVSADNYYEAFDHTKIPALGKAGSVNISGVDKKPTVRLAEGSSLGTAIDSAGWHSGLAAVTINADRMRIWGNINASCPGKQCCNNRGEPMAITVFPDELIDEKGIEFLRGRQGGGGQVVISIDKYIWFKNNGSSEKFSIETFSDFPFAPNGGSVEITANDANYDNLYPEEEYGSYDGYFAVDTHGWSVKSWFSTWYIIDGVSYDPETKQLIDPDDFCDGTHQYYNGTSAGVKAIGKDFDDTDTGYGNGLSGGNGGDVIIKFVNQYADMYFEVNADGGDGSRGGDSGDAGYCPSCRPPKDDCPDKWYNGEDGYEDVIPEVGLNGAGGDGGKGGNITIGSQGLTQISCFTKLNLSANGGKGGDSGKIDDYLDWDIWWAGGGEGDIWKYTSRSEFSCNLKGWGEGIVPERPQPNGAGDGGNAGIITVFDRREDNDKEKLQYADLYANGGIAGGRLIGGGSYLLPYPVYCNGNPSWMEDYPAPAGEEDPVRYSLLQLARDVETRLVNNWREYLSGARGWQAFVIERASAIYGDEHCCKCSGLENDKSCTYQECCDAWEGYCKRSCQKAEDYDSCYSDCTKYCSSDCSRSPCYYKCIFTLEKDWEYRKDNGLSYCYYYCDREEIKWGACPSTSFQNICRPRIPQTPCQDAGFTSNEKRGTSADFKITSDGGRAGLHLVQPIQQAFAGVPGSNGGNAGTISINSRLLSEDWRYEFQAKGGSGSKGSKGQSGILIDAGDGGNGGKGGDGGMIEVTNTNFVPEDNYKGGEGGKGGKAMEPQLAKIARTTSTEFNGDMEANFCVSYDHQGNPIIPYADWNLKCKYTKSNEDDPYGGKYYYKDSENSDDGCPPKIDHIEFNHKFITSINNGFCEPPDKRKNSCRTFDPKDAEQGTRFASADRYTIEFTDIGAGNAGEDGAIGTDGDASGISPDDPLNGKLCGSPPPPPVWRESDCCDNVDNDGDGLIDCQDPDCFIDCYTNLTGKGYLIWSGLQTELEKQVEKGTYCAVDICNDGWDNDELNDGIDANDPTECVQNHKPRVTELELREVENCFDSNPTISFLWRYEDDDNIPIGKDPQSKYEIGIFQKIGNQEQLIATFDGDKCQLDPIFGTGKCWTDYTGLNFATKYSSWKIRVRDSKGAWSDWASSGEFETNPAPPYPDFIWDKDSADSGEKITFTNVTPNIVGGAPPQRGCFNPNGCDYTWIFDGGDPNSAGPEGPGQQHTITFTEPIKFKETSTKKGNTKRIDLTATDQWNGVNRSCTVTAGITPGASRKRIKWREISPFEIPSR